MSSQQDQFEGFRQYLPDLNLPRFQDMKKKDAHVYAEDFKKHGNPPWLHGLYLHWRKLFQQPYQGITSDGKHCSWTLDKPRLTIIRRCKRWPIWASRRRYPH